MQPRPTAHCRSTQPNAHTLTPALLVYPCCSGATTVQRHAAVQLSVRRAVGGSGGEAEAHGRRACAAGARPVAGGHAHAAHIHVRVRRLHRACRATYGFVMGLGRARSALRALLQPTQGAPAGASTRAVRPRARAAVGDPPRAWPQPSRSDLQQVSEQSRCAAVHWTHFSKGYHQRCKRPDAWAADALGLS